MPDAFELPRMLRAVVPKVSSDFAFVNKLIALAARHAFRPFQILRAAAGCVPGLAAIIGTLNDLAEPAARLRSVNAIRVRGRSFEMINFPAREMRAADFPTLAL